jgi:hypothetical protein
MTGEINTLQFSGTATETIDLTSRISTTGKLLEGVNRVLGSPSTNTLFPSENQIRRKAMAAKD